MIKFKEAYYKHQHKTKRTHVADKKMRSFGPHREFVKECSITWNGIYNSITYPKTFIIMSNGRFAMT